LGNKAGKTLDFPEFDINSIQGFPGLHLHRKYFFRPFVYEMLGYEKSTSENPSISDIHEAGIHGFPAPAALLAIIALATDFAP
jgi:hypothetical protein